MLLPIRTGRWIPKSSPTRAPSGAFAGVTLNGASIRRDDDSTEATYGRDVSTRRILSGKIAVPASARAFLDAVRDAKAQAIASN